MQGLPTNLLTKSVGKPTVAGETKSPVGVNGQVEIAETPVLNGEVATTETKNSFADFFSNLMGGEVKADKNEKTLGAEKTAETKGQASAELKLDTMLKTKSPEHNQAQNKKAEQVTMTSEQALSPEVLKNIDNLLIKTTTPATSAPVDSKSVVGEKIVTASTNLEQLLKTLKGESDDVEVLEDGVQPQEGKNAKKENALDFLLKQSKESDVGEISIKDKNLLKTNPEVSSKLGLSSEDFVSHMNSKEVKASKGEKNSSKLDLAGEVVFDPKELVQKQMNSSMKTYGQKQNLLNDHLIKNTGDLAFKDSKPKSMIDELKTPDMKIGADLSHIKESFIPAMNNKQEASQQMEAQNSGKVLDLGKMNTSNTAEIVKKISDFVQQNQVANTSSLDLTVKHESLGQFNIQVNRPMDAKSNQMDMQITTATPEAHDFFVKNEIGLMKNLSQAGIQLSDLRIVSGGESMSFSQSDSRQSGHNNQQQAPKEFMSFDKDFSQGSDRRRELWQEARANQQRYGA